MKKILNLLLTLTLLITGALMTDAKAPIDPNEKDYTEVRAAHILVDTKSQANAIKMRVQSGESFSTLAKQFSKCPSKYKGGDLGYFGRGQMVEEFEKAAFSLPKDELSDPVQTDFGWHIIKVIDKK